ncbi:hypothetical protein MICAG_2700026 [Microcystis aeruginosa PCC 9808]|uniref:Type II toxin-antitoxin system mRNA interferase toxin, RelE/StbE family n=1 Tax=Microcystis aeruginosa PCC 9808 TaxID=1160284 RepID=I4HSX6_MICAE|nr:hypothetical protein MICAD_2300003 [Microcystis aeruginosa PCC 7941]CCI25150.1 hypothetical protein MICAG_2700026 [Microcystis aeruginosa PCC 9808]
MDNFFQISSFFIPQHKIDALLLIYQQTQTELHLIRTGSHSDLFN